MFETDEKIAAVLFLLLFALCFFILGWGKLLGMSFVEVVFIGAFVGASASGCAAYVGNGWCERWLHRRMIDRLQKMANRNQEDLKKKAD